MDQPRWPGAARRVDAGKLVATHTDQQPQYGFQLTNPLYAVQLMVARGVLNGAGSRRRVALLAALGVAVALLIFSGSAVASSAPMIESTSVSGVSEHDATLEASINPGGLKTSYRFWLGVGCFPASCNVIAEVRPSLPLESLSGTQGAQSVSLDLNSVGVTLEPNRDYYFFAVAVNADGESSDGHEGYFRTPPVGDPNGSGGGAPYEGKLEPWVNEGAEREAKEAPRLEEEREAKKKEEEERPVKEAAARAAKEREIREAGERAGREAAERELLTKQASTAMCVVPSLKGDSLATARRALGEAHCKLGKVSRPRGHHKTLVVAGQSAKSGKMLADGAAVAVRLGPIPKTRRG